MRGIQNPEAIIDSATDQEIVFRPLEGKEFRFRCHKGISCFTRCCAKLRLILTPYDILRLKKRLSLPSEEFLEQYTETLVEKGARFPMVILKMQVDGDRTCPFLIPEGCSVYEDRPAACRLYPIGRASMAVDGEDSEREKFFTVDESHCLGFQEDTLWTLEEWLDKEGVLEYNAANAPWIQIVTASRSRGPADHIVQKQQMFFMASYNLDRFRSFLFGSRFFDRFEVAPGMKRSLADDDRTLMQFGFEWLKFSLFSEKTLILKGSPNGTLSGGTP